MISELLDLRQLADLAQRGHPLANHVRVMSQGRVLRFEAVDRGEAASARPTSRRSHRARRAAALRVGEERRERGRLAVEQREQARLAVEVGIRPEPRLPVLVAEVVERLVDRDVPQALRYFRDVTTRQPDWPDAWSGLGWTLAKGGDRAEAERSFRRSLAAQPGYADAVRGLQELGKQP